MSRLDALRRKGYTSFQLMLLAKQTGDPLIAAEADAQAVVERLRRGPHALLPGEDVVTAQEAARLLTEALKASPRQVPR